MFVESDFLNTLFVSFKIRMKIHKYCFFGNAFYSINKEMVVL